MRVFGTLGRLVKGGSLAYPRQVVDELARAQPPDLPFKFAKHNFARMQYDQPDEDCVREVMQRAGGVVDPRKISEDADPYVLAMALCLKRAGHEAIVVTEDGVDRPWRISMATACGLLRLPWEGINDCLHAHRLL